MDFVKNIGLPPMLLAASNASFSVSVDLFIIPCRSNSDEIYNNALVFNLSDSLIYCGLDSVLLDVGLYESYSWNTGDTTQFLFAGIEGGYSIEVTDSVGCSAIDSFQLFLHDFLIGKQDNMKKSK